MALPSGYTRVEYLQSSGTQYIDTGFKPNQDTRVICRAKIPTGGNTNFLFGARQSEKSSGFYALYSSLGYYRQGYNTQQLNFSSELNSVGILVFDANKNTATITTDTDSDTKQGTYDTFASPVNLCLFACNNNGTLTYGSVSIYSCKIYDNGTLIRDLTPCKNASGEAGLYDRVNGVFYTNQGSGTFAMGAELPPDYKIVDAAELDSAMSETADAIRAKNRGTSKITWNKTTGFSAAITTQNKSVTPKASSQTIKPDAGYIGLGQVTVNGDADLKAANIAKGVNIFGVTGTLESGGKVATGSFFSTYNQAVTISGLGFKPKKIIIWLWSNSFCGDDDLYNEFEWDILYATYDETEDSPEKYVTAGMTTDDDDNYCFRIEPAQYGESVHLKPNSDGFTVDYTQGYLNLAWSNHYMYIAIG